MNNVNNKNYTDVVYAVNVLELTKHRKKEKSKERGEGKNGSRNDSHIKKNRFKSGSLYFKITSAPIGALK